MTPLTFEFGRSHGYFPSYAGLVCAMYEVDP